MQDAVIDPIATVDPSATELAEAEEPAVDDLLDEVLIEEISVDGMCGVY
jgi:mycofactocin precursor